MTKDQALLIGRAKRTGKILKKLYEQNYELINRDKATSYKQFIARVVRNKRKNVRYEEDSIVRAAHRTLHTLEFVDKETIGIENIKAALKKVKTGNQIKWGKENLPAGTPWWIKPAQKYKDETLYDVLRARLGHFKKQEWYWHAEDGGAYHIKTEDGDEEIAIISYGTPTDSKERHFIVTVNTDEYRQHLANRREWLDYMTAKKRR